MVRTTGQNWKNYRISTSMHLQECVFSTLWCGWHNNPKGNECAWYRTKREQGEGRRAGETHCMWHLLASSPGPIVYLSWKITSPYPQFGMFTRVHSNHSVSEWLLHKTFPRPRQTERLATHPELPSCPVSKARDLVCFVLWETSRPIPKHQWSAPTQRCCVYSTTRGSVGAAGSESASSEYDGKVHVHWVSWPLDYSPGSKSTL